MKPKVLEKLDALNGTRKYAKLVRSIPGSEILHGFVLARSNSLVLLHVVREFHLDGYSLIRVRDLESVECRREERFFQKMLDGEGVTQQVGASFKPAMSSVAATLNSVAKRNLIVSVECEGDEDELFLAGRVVSAGKTVEIHTFDACGRWDSSPESVNASEVTLVSWETEYLTTFEKYLPDA